MTSSVSQIVQGNYLLAFFYFMFYGSVLYVAIDKRLSFRLRASAPLLLLFTTLLTEFYYFGITGLSYAILYTLTIFAALLFGIRHASITLVFGACIISLVYWLDSASQAAISGPTPNYIAPLAEWISPLIGYLACVAMSIAAISIMFRYLVDNVQEKEQLVAELRHEISHREIAQNALKLSESQFNHLFEDSRDAVVFMKQDSGAIVLANEAAEVLFGLPQSHIQRTSLSELTPEIATQLLNKANSPDTAAIPEEFRITGAEKNQRTTEVTVTTIGDGMCFLIFRDLTKRKHLEQQIHHSQKMEAIGQLAGGIAHDFNNSLQVIIGFSELAKLKLDDEEVATDLDKIHESGQRAQSLVSQLLAFSRRQHLQIKPLNLGETLSESLHLLRSIAGEHIRVELEDKANNSNILGDRNQIEQILLNLCINARDAIKTHGEIHLLIEEVSITSEYCLQHPWAKPGDFVRLAVTDTGTGMPPEVQERIFEPFFTTKDADKGTGLGLSSVFGIMQQHQGFVAVASKPGQGTVFSVYLPATTQESDSETKPRPAPALNGTGTVLVVDDDEMVRNVTGRMLELAGYAVLMAGGGHEAIDIFKAEHSAIDLVILDVVMPKMHGSEVSIKLREMNPTIPVLFVTGYDRELINNDFIKKSDVHCLQKPFKQQELIQAVHSLTENSATKSSTICN
ncbi:MAG: response regulator [Gammaproteobacteria bacterium]